MQTIPLHKAFVTKRERENILAVLDSGRLSGNGPFTKKSHEFLEQKFGFPKCLLTASCTDALEMCSLILDLKPGDEILLPSYTFVSTANAFNNFGITPVFCDSGATDPNIDPNLIEDKITAKTKAIVVMHYAGISCEMQKIRQIADAHGLWLIEDSALALGSTYLGKPVGAWGDLSAFSFHETKNITCGEGGLLVVNHPSLKEKAEIIWEKGTNRAAFLRGESDRYEWVSKGSSFLTSEIHAAMLLAQLENFDFILKRRSEIWHKYVDAFSELAKIKCPNLPTNRTINGSLFYILLNEPTSLENYIKYMMQRNISVSTHYRNLHTSKWAISNMKPEKLINCEKIAASLIRLPIYTELTEQEQDYIIDQTIIFFEK